MSEPNADCGADPVLIDRIAQQIRIVDGSHTMGAAELAEHIAKLFVQIGWCEPDDGDNTIKNWAIYSLDEFTPSKTFGTTPLLTVRPDNGSDE